MKKLLFPLIAMMVVMLAGSCGSSKRVTYFKNIDTVNLAASQGLYDARIMPKDMLTITVSTVTPEASEPFNLYMRSSVGSSGQLSSGGGNLMGYLVDNEGNINFPVIGKIHVVGLTKNQCQDLIASKISPYLSATEKPIVTVRMSSFHVTVIGEVGGPKVVPVTTEKMNVIEAIASAGDLGIFGKRDNVLLVREDANGQREAHRLNLNDANIFNSPYYYLQQNDIIYVEPGKLKTNSTFVGTSTSLWVSLFSAVMGVASVIISLAK